jgi:hypothetical protein
MTEKIVSSQAICRIRCKSCKRFVGVIRPDGTGPYLDECLDVSIARCAMLSWTQQFAPKRMRGYDLGSTPSRLDNDAGGYQSIAIRAMEDGGG